MASLILNGSYRTEKCELGTAVCLHYVNCSGDSWVEGVHRYLRQSGIMRIHIVRNCALLLEFYRWLCAIVKRWWPILEQSFKFTGVLWLLKWSSCEKVCLVGKINQYASEWQQRLFECVIFLIFFQAWNRTGSGLAMLVVHPFLLYYIDRVTSMKAMQAPVA